MAKTFTLPDGRKVTVSVERPVPKTEPEKGGKDDGK